MSATLPDVILTNIVYQDLYASTSITKGTTVVIQNKGVDSMYLIIAASQPSASSTNGFIVEENEVVIVNDASDGLWAKGHGAICVQIYVPLS